MKQVRSWIDGDIQKNVFVDEDGNVTVQKIQDNTAWIERNRAIRETATGKESLRHIGFIPDCVIDLWKREGIDIFNKDHMPKVIEKLSSNEFQLLKTAEGRI